MPSLTEILQAAGSPDANLRQQAELELRKFEQADFAGYIQGICAELADPNKPPAVRQLAGLVLKNTMSSPDAAKQKELESRWTLQGVPVRAKIKAVTLQVLASPVGDARKTAAQVISRIAAIEMPHDQWPELIGQLVASVQQGSDDLKEASFTTLGFVCEEVPEHLEKHANSILNAINIGMQATQTNNKIKLAATKALVNSLEFTHNNFAEQRQRDMIMELVFGVCGSSDEQCQIFAFQCLVEMGQLYYDHLTPYMPRIFGLTKAGIENFKQREQVALRAIEFWSTTCDEEADIIEENEIAADKQKAPERKLLNFVETAMSSLLPLVLQCLTCQEEDTDEDDWNIAMAAGSCLGLIAQTARNKVCDFVLPFVQANIQDADWHKREAAVLAFGSILNGPDPDKLKPLVGQVFGLLLNLLEDSSVAVQDSAAWTIGRVCDLLPSDHQGTPDGATCRVQHLLGNSQPGRCCRWFRRRDLGPVQVLSEFGPESAGHGQQVRRRREQPARVVLRGAQRPRVQLRQRCLPDRRDAPARVHEPSLCYYCEQRFVRRGEGEAE